MSETNQARRLPLAKMVERHPEDGWSLAVPLTLSSGTQRALEGLVAALLPPRPAPRSLELDRRVTTHVRSMLQYMPTPLRLGFLLLVRLLDLSPIWRFSGLSRLSKLEPEKASRILQGIATSRLMLLRLMMLAPKAMVLSTYFDQDEVHAFLNYEPKSFLRERIARREQLLEEERASLTLAGGAPVSTTSAEVAE